MAYALSLILNFKNIKHTPVEEEKSKLVDMVLLGLNNVAIPDTYFTLTKNLKNSLSSIEKFCGYPFIIKPVEGSLGDDMYLVNSKDDFDNACLKLNPKLQYLCQKFIPNKFDYRAIVVNKKLETIAMRIRTKDAFRNNVSLGAEGVFVDAKKLPKEVVEITEKSTSVLGLDWAGVDIVTSDDTGKSYILEVNRRPDLCPDSTEITAAKNYILGLLQ